MAQIRTVHSEELEFLEARELMYRILGAGFLQAPGIEQVQRIAAEKLFDAWPLELETPDFQRGLNLLRVWVRQSEDHHPEEIQAQVVKDYLTLFSGPHKLPAPPWESVYRTEEKLTFDLITLEVREFYRRHGLEYRLKNSEPDDHFGAELEFMAELILRQGEQIRKGRPAEALSYQNEQRRFVREHLGQWSEEFIRLVIAHAQSAYYQGLAYIAAAYLTWEKELLSLNSPKRDKECS